MLLRGWAPASRCASGRCAWATRPRGRSVAPRARLDKNDPLSWSSASSGEEETEAAVTQLLSAAEFAALVAASSTPAAVAPRGEQAPRAAAPPSSDAQPDTAASATRLGLALAKAGDHAAALALFETALTLPGAGVVRVRGGAPELTPGEQQYALYNAACCRARLGDADGAAAALAACVAAGFEDGAALRGDPDLVTVLQTPAVAALLARLPRGSGGPAGWLAGLFGRA